MYLQKVLELKTVKEMPRSMTSSKEMSKKKDSVLKTFKTEDKTIEHTQVLDKQLVRYVVFTFPQS